jgi:hypothetical protein
MTAPTKTTDPRPLSVQLSDPLPSDRWSDLDGLVADPLIERAGLKRKPSNETARVLQILDELQMERTTHE